MQAPPAADRKAEVYLGNCIASIATGALVCEVFNAVLAPLVAAPGTTPPVVTYTMDPSGNMFCDVEFESEELCSVALQLGGTLELQGRALHVARPGGYVDGCSPEAAAAALAVAQERAACLAAGTSHVLLVENMGTCGPLRLEAERIELAAVLEEEAATFGRVVGVAVPLPLASLGDDEPGRAFVKFGSAAEALVFMRGNEGRAFDNKSTMQCSYATEFDFARALNGEWVDKGKLGVDAAASAAVPSISFVL